MKNVLLVDDDPIVISLYTALFRHNGIEVRCAYDGVSALECVAQRKPDAVLLDLSMPKLDGLAWLRAVRADARYRQIPVVILTAGAIPALVEEAESSDALRVLSKHRSDPDEVVNWVVSALSSGAMPRP